MACQCKNVDMGSYDAAIPLTAPAHMLEYMRRRMDKGLNSDGKISIDACIAEEIVWLWGLGIHTRGCCCGHNKSDPMVNVADESIDLMIRLGYEMNHDDHVRRDTFKLKSV